MFKNKKAKKKIHPPFGEISPIYMGKEIEWKLNGLFFGEKSPKKKIGGIVKFSLVNKHMII